MPQKHGPGCSCCGYDYPISSNVCWQPSRDGLAYEQNRISGGPNERLDKPSSLLDGSILYYDIPGAYTWEFNGHSNVLQNATTSGDSRNWFNPTTDWTIDFGVVIDNTAAEQGLFEIRSTVLSTRYIVRVKVSALSSGERTFTVEVKDDNEVGQSTSVAVTEESNSVYHVAIRYDSTNETIDLDVNENSATQLDISSGGGLEAYGLQTLRLGIGFAGSYTTYDSEWLYWRHFTSLLTDTDITELYNSGDLTMCCTSGPTSELLAGWTPDIAKWNGSSWDPQPNTEGTANVTLRDEDDTIGIDTNSHITNYGWDWTGGGLRFSTRNDDKVANFNHATSTPKINVSRNSAFNNPWPGTVVVSAYIESDGYSTVGTIWTKNYWTLRTEDQSGSNVRLKFWAWCNSAWATWITPVDVSINTWHDIAVVWDGNASTLPKIYLDGVAETVTVSAAGTGSVASDSGSDLIIGNRSAGSRTFDGQLHRFRIYKGDQLSAATLVDYAAGTEPSETIDAEWVFNGNSQGTPTNGTDTGITYQWPSSVLNPAPHQSETRHYVEDWLNLQDDWSCLFWVRLGVLSTDDGDIMSINSADFSST